MTPTPATAAKAPMPASQHASPKSDIEIAQAAKKIAVAIEELRGDVEGLSAASGEIDRRLRRLATQHSADVADLKARLDRLRGDLVPALTDNLGTLNSIAQATHARDSALRADVMSAVTAHRQSVENDLRRLSAAVTHQYTLLRQRMLAGAAIAVLVVLAGVALALFG